MKSLIIKSVAVVCAVLASASCMTTYDAYGRPLQSVDPGVATAGVVAAGVLGYALANDNDHHHDRRYDRRYDRYDRHRHYRHY